MTRPKAKQAGARGRRQAAPKADRITNPEARGDAVFGAIYGALRPLDELAARMESKWGYDRLETLVSPDTASKFAAVRERLNAAIDAADVAAVRHEASILYRGWIALDAEATRLGAEPRPSTVWEMAADSGKVYRVTLTDEQKFGLCAHLPKDEAARVLSLEELLRVYEFDKLAVVREAQRLFPGGKISYAGPVREETKEALGVADDDPGPLFETPTAQGLEDEIPF